MWQPCKCLSKDTVYKWCKKFINGIEELDNSPRAGAPNTAATETKKEAVNSLIQENRRIKMKDISSILNISVGTVYKIIHEDLKYRKNCVFKVGPKISYLGTEKKSC